MEHLPLLNRPIDAVVFDCDSTLSKVEGIDELARLNGHGEKVLEMTHQAMSHTGVNNSLYSQRLDLVKPTQEQMKILGDLYYQHRTPGAEATIKFLSDLGKKVFIMSAGLLPPVQLFGEQLGIAKSAAYAVDIFFDKDGNYSHYEEDSLLTGMTGKREIIRDLTEFYPRIIHVGDGLNDIESREVAARFIGYGGVTYRENIAKVCDYYVTHPSLLSILPLCLTRNEIAALSSEQFSIFQEGVQNLQKMESLS